LSVVEFDGFVVSGDFGSGVLDEFVEFSKGGFFGGG